MTYCQSREGRSEAEYNPFDHPPNLAKAVKHYRSTLVGVSNISSNSQLCECCGRVIEKQRLDLKCSYTQLGFLSHSLALYFRVIKLAIILLIAVLLPAIILNMLRLDLADGPLSAGMQALYIGERELAKQLLFGQTFISIISIYFISKCCKTSLALIQKASPTPEQYTLKLENLPECSEEDLKIWIFNKFGEYPQTVIFAYDTKELSQSFLKREELTIQLNRLIIDRPNTKRLSTSATLLLEENDRRKVELRGQIEEQDEILNKYTKCLDVAPCSFTGVAFVVFDGVQKVREILKEYEVGVVEKLCERWRGSRAKVKYNESQIEIEPAPNPRDVIWDNLRISQYKVLLTYTVLFLGINWLLGPTFVNLIQLLTQIWPDMLLVVCLVFYLLYHLLVHLFVTFFLNKLECSTYTRRALISFYSYGIFNVIFPAMLPYSLGLAEEETVQFIHALLLVDALTHSAIKSFNVANVYSRIYCEYINHLPADSNPYTQGYFNRLMEGWEFKIGQNYHYLFRGISLCAFFARPAPLGALFYMVSFMIEFSIQKYILLRKCKTPPKVSSALSNHFLTLLHFLPALALLGAYVFDLHYQKGEQLVDGVEMILVLACCLCLIGMQHCRMEEDMCERSYRQMEALFTEFYEVENEINKYNGDMRQRNRTLVLRLTAQSEPQPNIEDFFVEEQEIQPEKTADKKHHNLVKRLLSYNVEMYSIHSNNSRVADKI